MIFQITQFFLEKRANASFGFLFPGRTDSGKGAPTKKKAGRTACMKNVDHNGLVMPKQLIAKLEVRKRGKVVKF